MPRPENLELTKAQSGVLEYVRTRLAAGGRPTVREIAAEFHWNSSNTAATHIASLVRKGRLYRTRTTKRLQLVAAPDPGVT